MEGYSLLTNVLQASHLRQLDDWIEFLGRPPVAIIAYVGHDKAVEFSVREFCKSKGLKIVLLEPRASSDIKADETALLMEQFKRVETPFAFLTRLDTIAYRNAHSDWLDLAMRIVTNEDLLFFTSSTRRYRADLDHSLPGWTLTNRVSNNCLLIRPEDWLQVQARYPDEERSFGRFATEALIEHHCRMTGIRGLRRVSTDDWRVFHTQIWDERMTGVRDRFLAGRGIQPFLHGFEDDQRHDWQRYYGPAKPPLLRRMRVRLSEARRQLTKSILAGSVSNQN